MVGANGQLLPAGTRQTGKAEWNSCCARVPALQIPHLSEDTAVSNACSLAAKSMDRPMSESSCAVIASAAGWGQPGREREVESAGWQCG